MQTALGSEVTAVVDVTIDEGVLESGAAVGPGELVAAVGPGEHVVGAQMHGFAEVDVTVDTVVVGRVVVGDTGEGVTGVPDAQGLLGIRFVGPFIASTMVFVKINGIP